MWICLYTLDTVNKLVNTHGRNVNEQYKITSLITHFVWFRYEPSINKQKLSFAKYKFFGVQTRWPFVAVQRGSCHGQIGICNAVGTVVELLNLHSEDCSCCYRHKAKQISALTCCSVYHFLTWFCTSTAELGFTSFMKLVSYEIFFKSNSLKQPGTGFWTRLSRLGDLSWKTLELLSRINLQTFQAFCFSVPSISFYSKDNRHFKSVFNRFPFTNRHSLVVIAWPLDSFWLYIQLTVASCRIACLMTLMLN